MSSFGSAVSPSNLPYYPSNLDVTGSANHSHGFPLLSLNDTWILPIFILCLLGIVFTIIISLLFICLSHRRLNDHFLLTNLFLCISVCFIYISVIVFLIRANELFCGLREFLSQFAYALLYSALLCRYIMQWLGSRILSKRTKQSISLLLYLLLIFIQIPIGILWWYFTTPRICRERRLNILSSKSHVPKFHFRKPIIVSSMELCSHRCIVDYRFYATFTYPIIELILCTLIAICFFFCRHCHRNRTERGQEKIISMNGNNPRLAFLNMFAFILIDLVWIGWTLMYYFTHPFFIFPSFIIGMFAIASICLLFMLIPQLCYYSKMQMNDVEAYKSKSALQPTTLYSNKLASADDMKDQELLLEEKPTDRRNKKQKTLSNGSDLSDELDASGTFLPITRTPKGPFKVTATDEITPVEKLDQLIYGNHQSTPMTSSNRNGSNVNEIKVNASFTDAPHHQGQRLQPPMAPLQRQSTSSSIASDFVTPVVTTGLTHRTDSYRNPNADIRTSSSMYYSGYPPPRRDETIIPILCTSDRPRTSTPVQMRVLLNSPSSSVPTTRRMHSGTDIRYVRHPYQPMYPPSTTPPYYSPQPPQQQYLFVDPYRTMPSRVGGNTWHSVLLQPGSKSYRYPYPSRRFQMDQRSLSQRLWDIDSGDDEDEMEEDIVKVAGRLTPTKERLNDFRSHHVGHEDNILLHIDDDAEEDDDGVDDTYQKQYAHV